MVNQIFRSIPSKLVLFYITLLMLISFSCENSTQIETYHSPDFKVPVVTGLRITNYDPFPIATWKKPDDTDSKRNDSVPYMLCPYPNPADGNFAIHFSTGRKSVVVSLWVVKAKSGSENYFMTTHYFDALLPAPVGFAKEILLNKENLSIGQYKYLFEAREYPAGFYRIYLKVNSQLFWRDILIYQKRKDIPQDLFEKLPPDFPLWFKD